MNLIPVGIAGLGKYLPEERITNADLAELVDTSDEWIVQRTGIRERRRVRPGQCSSDLGAEAARSALEDAGVAPEEVGGCYTPAASLGLVGAAQDCFAYALCELGRGRTLEDRITIVFELAQVALHAPGTDGRPAASEER